jgi:hypothetical protein
VGQGVSARVPASSISSALFVTSTMYSSSSGNSGVLGSVASGLWILVSDTRRFRSEDGASQSSFGGSFARHRVVPTPRHPPRPRGSRNPPIDLPVGDLEALEEFEMAQDLAAHREAKAADDGGRVTLDELRRGAAQ